MADDSLEGGKEMNNLNERGHSRRKWLNRVMLVLCGTATAIAMLMLALILGYALIRGISYLNLTILTQAAKPVGETGGGMRNEIFRNVDIGGAWLNHCAPIGLLAGIYVAEYANPNMAAAIRFTADILAGVPSIVVGVFVYAIMVIPMHSYSAISAGVALAIIMVPLWRARQKNHCVWCQALCVRRRWL